MPSCGVRPVKSKKDLRQFVQLPYDLYQGNPFWVPPLRVDQFEVLNPRKHPFYDHGRTRLFLAFDQSGAVVGRIAAIINGMHLKTHSDDAGFFGFFESINQYEVAKSLLDAATQWLRHEGMQLVRGPVNPSINDPSGLLVDGFDRTPSIMMTYNPPYYKDFLTRWGFTRAMTLWAYYVHRKHVRIDRLRRGASIVRRRNPDLSIRCIDLSRFDQEAEMIRDIFNDAWSDNWGYVPFTQREFEHLAKGLKQIVDTRICFVLQHKGEDIGFSISLPDINPALKRLPDGRLLPFGLAKLLILTKFARMPEVRIPLMGIRKAYQGRAFDVLAVLETIDKTHTCGYLGGELSWVLDDNYLLKNHLDSINAVIDKEYAILEAPLNS